MLGLAAVGLSLAWGIAAARATRLDLEADLLLPLGGVLGLATGAWAVYAVSVGGLTTASLVVSCVFLGVLTLAALIAGRGIAWPRPPVWLVGTAVAALAGFALLNLHAVMRVRAGGTVVAVGNVWADLPFHAAVTTGFAYRDNIPPYYPLAIGAPLGYPFLVDFASAILVAGGLTLRASVVIVNTLLHAAFVLGVVALVRRLTGSVRVALVTAGVLLLLGNLGVLAVPGDVRAAGGVLRWLSDLQWDYTGESLGTQGRARLGTGLYLGNPTFEFLLPRRSGAFGLAVGTPALALAAHLFARPTVRGGILLGVALGLLPRVHAHSAIAIAVVLPVWAVAERAWRNRGAWAAGVTAAAIAAPQVLTMRSQATRFIDWGFLGWTGEAHRAFERFPPDVGAFAWFWVLNGGLLVLLLPAAVALRGGPRRFYAGFAALFGLANVVKTQPWEWDNSAYFVWWQVGTVSLVVPFLARRLAGRWRPVAAVCAAALVAGGPLSALRTLRDDVDLWTTSAARFADDVRHVTPPDAVVLTANGHAEPVIALSGRQVVMGFSGWLANHGLDSGRYQAALESLFAGDEEVRRHLGVGYVVLGPWERGFAVDHDIDLSTLERLPLVFSRTIDGQEWSLHRVSDSFPVR